MDASEPTNSSTHWTVDTDRDGADDGIAFDRGTDGVPDAIGFDSDDGRMALLDSDGDGRFDAEVFDLDGDGTFDAALVDTDADGTFETQLERGEDGEYTKVDERIVLPDETDKPATPDKPESTDKPDKPESTDKPDDRTDNPWKPVHTDEPRDTTPDGPDDETPRPEPAPDPVPEPPANPDPPTRADPPAPVDTMAGDPEADAARWFFQVDNGLCMPASVTQIVVEMTNGQHTYEEVQQTAIQNGWLQKGPNEQFMTDKGYGWSGMYTEDGEKLLEAFDIDAQIVDGMTTDQLATYLDSGYDIIATIDGDEVWYGLDDDTSDGGFASNHALVVTGVDTTRGVVVLNDPGDEGRGRAREVPLNTFLDAWADSGNQAIVATPPAGIVPSGETYGDIDLVRTASPGVVVLPVVLDATSFLDPDKWQ